MVGYRSLDCNNNITGSLVVQISFPCLQHEILSLTEESTNFTLLSLLKTSLHIVGDPIGQIV